MQNRFLNSSSLVYMQPTWPHVSQFLLGPSPLNHLHGWRRSTIANHFTLASHPDLACTQVRNENGELTLLGHLLDPRAPESSNEDLLEELLRKFNDRDALIQATTGFGGRWLIIAINKNEAFLFHDALGLRQVFYTDPIDAGTLIAMSQPGLANGVCVLVPDVAASEYMDTQTFRRADEYRWPGTASGFKNLKHLLPNHWLDLKTGVAERYWPSAPMGTLSPETATDRLGVLLSGQICAAANRFPLALSLTAGMDSRAVLAAARKLVNRICLMTVRQGRLTDNHPDIAVPARLLNRLKLQHHVVHANSMMTPEFSLRFKRNVYLAHDHYGHDAEAILRHFGRQYAALTGSGAEVGRCPFRGKLPHADHIHFTPSTFAWLEYGSTHPFLIEHFTQWLQDAERQKYVKLLDLFEWEQDYGNWLAMVQLEFDVAWREIFTPYNCREVLMTLLAVDERYRRPRDGLLWQMYIQKTWPELLDEPINPHRVISRFSQAVKDIKAVRRYWAFSLRQHERSIRT